MENSTSNSNYNEAKVPIILFDGVCNLCNQYVNFVIKRTEMGRFRFGTLQSDSAKILLKKNGLSTETMDTVVMIDQNQLLTKSDVALRVAKDMKGVWPIFGFLRIFPKGLRDGIYQIISNNRYRWFGKKDTCMIPTPELKKLFID